VVAAFAETMMLHRLARSWYTDDELCHPPSKTSSTGGSIPLNYGTWSSSSTRCVKPIFPRIQICPKTRRFTW
jgi:hypothetical protein